MAKTPKKKREQSPINQLTGLPISGKPPKTTPQEANAINRQHKEDAPDSEATPEPSALGRAMAAGLAPKGRGLHNHANSAVEAYVAYCDDNLTKWEAAGEDIISINNARLRYDLARDARALLQAAVAQGAVIRPDLSDGWKPIVQMERTIPEALKLVTLWIVPKAFADNIGLGRYTSNVVYGGPMMEFLEQRKDGAHWHDPTRDGEGYDGYVVTHFRDPIEAPK